jgi:acyl carrier protein
MDSGKSAELGKVMEVGLASGEGAQELLPTPLELELLDIIAKVLNLEVIAAEVDPTQPIYGEGLGLDSIDILEISLAISKHYGVQLKSDDPNNKQIYRSVRDLCAFLQAHRIK